MKLIYLSGAPRVSTRMNAEASGPRSHVLGVINGFRKLGWEVKEFIYGDMAPQKWTSSGSAKSVSSSFVKRLAADIMRIFLRVKNRRKVYQLHKDSVPDLVYERFAAFQELGSMFQKRGSKWILETNAPLFYEAKNERNSSALNGIMKRLELRAYQKCDILICVSNALKDIITNNLDVPPEKIFVMPNGVDLDEFSSDNCETIRMTEDFCIGFVGTTQHWQRLDLLFQAVSELRQLGHKITCTIVGDGNAYDDWTSLVKKNKWEDFIFFTGRVNRSQVPSYIKGFDICYSAPQHMEIGLYVSPLKLYEYMAMGKPVLASNTEDSKTLLTQDSIGYLFEFGNLDEMKEKILAAFMDQDGLKRMGDIARINVEQKYTWSQRLEKMLEISKILNDDERKV